MRVLLFTIIVICLTHFVNAQNYTLYPNIQFDTIPGIKPNLLSLDVYKPTKFSGLRPVIIIIHGGYWNVGDKTAFQQAYMADLFADSGYVSVSINYRLSPDPVDTISATAVRFPIHPQDCANAVSWIVSNIANYSGDTSKVSLMGHSAGAHLVLLLSTNESFLKKVGLSLQKIKCTCSLDAGVFDVAEELKQAESNISRRAPLINAFGKDTSLYDDASPQLNIQLGKSFPDFLLIHQNTSDRIYSNKRFKDSLFANGYNKITLFNANPYDHNQTASMIGNPLDTIGETTTMMSFFRTCLDKHSTDVFENIEKKSIYTVYPNPTSTTLFIQGQTENISQYEIVNIFGQILQRVKIFNNEIDVSKLESGVFIIRLISVKNKIEYLKFIKI